MARINYGSSGGDFAAETRKAEELSASTEQVNQKLGEYRANTESLAGTEEGSAKVRTGLADSTEALSAALRANISSISAETAALRTNSAELERQITLRRELAAAAGGRGGGGGVLPPVAYASGGPEEDPANLRAQLAAREQQIASLQRRGSVAFVPGPGGSSPSEQAARFAATTEDPRLLKQGQDYYETVAQNEQKLRGLGAAQAASNAEFQSAAAAYASSSGALSRHGALTTEFIQALARGQVTMREFGSQMVSTIGKFGGWIAAGAAVYGVVKLFGDLTKGATETQTAVEQMGRFIPGLGGPAGGGTGQIQPFEDQLRGISTQFNVPISEVTTSMMVMARTFHTVTDAANATRAALAVQRLDLVPSTQTEQYLVGIAGSLGYAGQRGGGQQLINVVNQLNELQSQGVGRVAQVLPGLARAVPAALASGTNVNQLEALVALGVRGGATGNQVGTALLRSMTGFAFRPGSEATYGTYGITAIPGEYGNLIEQIMNTISERAKSGHPLGRTDLTQLASALGGPQLGGRSLLPLLIQQADHPDRNYYQQVLDYTRHPRSYQEDLNSVLDTVGERFKSIGIALQNFGSQLAESGALQPLISMLTVFKDLAGAVENVISPMARVIGIFNRLPGFVQELGGAVALFGAARWASQSTRFGGLATAAISRLPGLGGLYSDSRAEVTGAVGRYQTYLLPVQEQELDAARAARLRAASQVTNAQAVLAQRGPGLQAVAGLGGTAGAEATAELNGLVAQEAAAQKALNTAKDKELAASTAVAQTEADIEVLKNNQLSWSTRASYLEQRGAVLQEELVNVKQQLVEQAYVQLGVTRGGGTLTGGALYGAASADATAARVNAEKASSTEAALVAAVGGVGVVGAAAAARRGQLSLFGGTSGALGGPAGAEQLALFPGAAGTSAAAAEAEVAAQQGFRARLAARLGPLASGPALPLFGTLASSAVPGYAGNVLQGGFSDMLLASFIPGAGAALKLGAFALGATQTPQTNGGLGQSLLSRGFGVAAGALGLRAAAPLISRGVGALAARAGTALFGEEAATALGVTDVVAPELGIPLTIAGALLGGIFGGSGSPTPPQPQPTSWANNADAQSALHAVIYGGPRGRAAFGANVEGMLASAYRGTGASAQRNQQTAQAIVGSLTAQLGLFGSGSVEGQAAQQGISQFMQSAATYARENPIFTQQLLSTFTQASNQEVQRRFQFQLSQGGGGAASSAIARTQATTVQPLQDALSRTQELASTQQSDLASLQGRASTATGKQKAALEKQIAAQREQLSKSQADVQTLTSMTQLARENATLQEQQYASQELQANQSSIQAQGQLAAAKAGGSQEGQARAALVTAQKSLQAVKTQQGLSPRQRRDATAQAQAALLQAHTQLSQQGLAGVEAAGAVAEASTPIGNSAADAAAKAQAAYAAWQYMAHNAHAFDPNTIKQAWAAVLQARKDAIQAAADQATQLNDLHAQLAEAQAYGDPIAQANIALASAQRDISLAVTPQQKLQAQVNYANAQQQANQAAETHIQDLGQLAASQLPGDPVGQAAALVRSAQAALAAAHGTENIITAQTALNNANKAYYDAVTQQVDTYYQTYEIQAGGNVLLQAAYARAQAAYDAARAQGPGEAAKAAQEAAQAAEQTYAAHQQVSQERTALAVARDVYNPVEAARRQIRGLDSQIRRARREGRPDDVRSLEAQRAQAEYQLHQAEVARISSRGTLREARESGNSVAAAETGVDLAQQLVRSARGTAERQAAEAQLAAAEHQLTQARIARAQALAQIEETKDTGNVIAQAQDALAAAARERALAKGKDARIKARQDEATARQQEIAAEQQRAQEYGQLAEANAGGDPVATARAALAAAQRQLELAHGIDQQIQAEAAVANAQTQLHQALENQIIALGNLAASTTRDPLVQLQDQMAATAKALANAHTPSERIQYQTQLNSLRNQYQATLIQQTEDTINFQLQMRQITSQQAIAQLQSLLQNRALTLQERQSIEEQIRSLQLGSGTSEFNLAPGNIKLPTIYDVARAMHGAVAASPFGTGSVSATANTTINVEVANAEDVPKVAAAIDQATGSQLAGALRAAGM